MRGGENSEEIRILLQNHDLFQQQTQSSKFRIIIRCSFRSLTVLVSILAPLRDEHVVLLGRDFSYECKYYL
jgi:hypothetical protein